MADQVAWRAQRQFWDFGCHAIRRLTMTLPNFLIIGAQRAGTTLLHSILDTHPMVYMPRRRKEVHYFDLYYARGPLWYQGFFPQADEAKRYHAIGEATPDYLFTPGVAGRIHSLLPDCQLIMCLRNPVDRTYSWYSYARRSFNERRSFNTYLDEEPEVLRRGCYYGQIKTYLDYFAMAQLHVFIYEEFILMHGTHLERIAKILNLETGWDNPQPLLGRRSNTSEQPYFGATFALARKLGSVLRRHDLDFLVETTKRFGAVGLFGRRPPPEAISAEARCRLARFYADDIRRLEDLLQRDLDLWRQGAAPQSANPPKSSD